MHGQEYKLRAATWDPQNRHGGVEIRVPFPFDTLAVQASVDVRFTAPSGELQHVTYSGVLELFEPNGPDCEPHVYQLSRFIHDGQVLTYAQMEAQFAGVLFAEQTVESYVLTTDDDAQSGAQS